jgi:hypothetical protein
MKHFRGTRPIPTPQAAREMYLRNAVLIPWDAEKNALVLREFRDLMARWQFDPKPDTEWDCAEPFTTASGRSAFKGNCNDFAPMLRRTLVAAGLPEDALRLVICDMGERGHMLLAIETDAGTMLCCNITGCWPLDSDNWEHYAWIAWEGPGRAWESLEATEPVSLERLLPGE